MGEQIQPLQVFSTKEAPLNPASAFILSGTHKTLTRKMAEITEEQFQALNDQADAEAALKAKLEEENVALGEEIAALEADLAILKAASADADGTKAALAKKKADLEAKIADLEKEYHHLLSSFKCQFFSLLHFFISCYKQKIFRGLISRS